MFPFLSHLVSLSSTLFLHFLSVSLFCFFTLLSLSCSFHDPFWDIFSWVFFYLLSLLFDKNDIQMKGQTNVTLQMFQGDSTCLWSPEEGAWVEAWAMEGETSKEDGYVLDKIKGGEGHFRVPKAVGTKIWGFYQGKRDVERHSYLMGSGNCCLPGAGTQKGCGLQLIWAPGLN